MAPAVIQTYELTPVAIGLGVNGLTVSFAGSPIAQQAEFDVIAAIAAAGGGGQFSVCDNALKQALDELEWVQRV